MNIVYLLLVILSFTKEDEETKLKELDSSNNILLGNVWINVFNRRVHVVVYDE